jgi:nitrogenase molybdenum-iron protein alpha chain
MTKMKTAPTVDSETWIDEVLTEYPAKVGKKRRKHMVARQVDPEGECQQIQANVRTVPGIITQRGCCYAGCKGVVIGPIGDMVHITHGPIGCGFYSWLTRRNFYKPREEDGPNYLTYCFSTDLQDEDIIFGGEKKLRQAIKEAYELFQPKGISVHSTCPVGLIGDDVKSVAREMQKELGVEILAFNCEGYKGVSQSAGHHIANNTLFTQLVDSEPMETEIPEFAINILGEYNIGGDAWEIERVFKRCGINVVSTFSGDASVDDMRSAQFASLNLVMCHRSINYMAEMMEERFGIPWLKVNFIGLNGMAKSLRKIAAHFGNPDLTAKVEEVIAGEMAEAQAALVPYRKRLTGKSVVLFVGGSRAHHYQVLFKDLGMEPIVAGYEFAHRDDYEGRQVIPNLKVDADSRNIEEIKVTPHPERYRPRLSEEEIERRKAEGRLSDYDGLWEEMGAGTLVIDDVAHHELEAIILKMKPDIVCSGIKDKYVIEKFGLPSKQLHNYDYSGPFAGFKGAVNFAREIDMMIRNPAWKLSTPPWEKSPTLSVVPNLA